MKNESSYFYLFVYFLPFNLHILTANHFSAMNYNMKFPSSIVKYYGFLPETFEDIGFPTFYKQWTKTSFGHIVCADMDFENSDD